MVAFEAQAAIAGSELVLVQGDTSSALGGALAAHRTGIPTGHVEAGLRTHDDRNPWPEEGFRKRIDAISTLLFAPTELSAAYLRREQARGTIHVTGNTAVDAAFSMISHVARPSRESRSDSWSPVTGEKVGARGSAE